MQSLPPIKIAVLDLYEGSANMGIACIEEILTNWGNENHREIDITLFEVRVKNELPDQHFDLYLSSGGPGSPIDTNEMDWDKNYCNWLTQMHALKKSVLLICHSFQLACRHFEIGKIGLRKSKQLGILPVHPIDAHPIFKNLADPFYALESRLYQITEPNDAKIKRMGASIIALEKNRPQLPYERALMAVAFNEHMIGVQFHPEATQNRLVDYFESNAVKQAVIEDFSIEKWEQIMLSLQDETKIKYTCSHFIPNFLNKILLV